MGIHRLNILRLHQARPYRQVVVANLSRARITARDAAMAVALRARALRRAHAGAPICA